MRWIVLASLLLISGAASELRAQSTPPPGAFDTRFFEVLRTVFDRFTNTDLKGAFNAASPIRCEELLGDWRAAAFFNDDPRLERFFYKTFDEVQADLSRYVFQGRCGSETADLDLSTRFPVRESMEAYNRKEIEFDRIAFNANASVRAEFDSKTRTYAFELPYLYVIGQQNRNNVYSMVPPNAAAKYSPDVTNRWECKAVKAADITYRFLICRTEVVPRNKSLRRQADEGARGTSAYVVLTDGREAGTSVKLMYPAGAESAPAKLDLSTIAKIVDVVGKPFRLSFPRASWEDKIGSTAMLAAGRLTAASAPPAEGDYCEWRAQSPTTNSLLGSNSRNVDYFLAASDKDGGNPVTITFEARTTGNIRLGSLRCVFPGAEFAARLDMNRFTSIIGDHIVIESR